MKRNILAGLLCACLFASVAAYALTGGGAAANQTAALCAGSGTGAFAMRVNSGGAVWM